MEHLEEIIKGMFTNSLNPGFCVRVIEKGEDPLIEFVLCNNEFSKMINGLDKEYYHKSIRVAEIDKLNRNTIVGNIIRHVIAGGEEFISEIENPILQRSFSIKGFIPAEGYVGVIMADVTEYQNARMNAQKMCELANSSMEQLKYQVDLLTATQNELKHTNHIHEIMFGLSSDGFYYKNYETGVFYAADSFYELFTQDGVRPEDNQSIKKVIFEQDVFTYSKARESAINEKKTEISVSVRIGDGSVWLKNDLKFTYDADGKLIEEVGFFKNTTTERKQQEELAYHAFFDSLTGLANRSYFTKLLDEDIERAKEDNSEIQIIYVDVDDFKKVNDSIGFQLGDELIFKFSGLLKGLEREGVRVGRFDSDEFVISIYDGTRNEANNIALEIRRQLMKAFELGHGISVALTASIGIAEYPTHGQHAIDVVSSADVAVHRVKNNGKNGVMFFEESMLEQLLNKIEMEKNITHALENDNFLLCYQPQYYTDTTELRGFEALIRMKDDNGGLIPPAFFIPVAEGNGSIVEIGEWVIHQALEDYNYWRREYGFDGVISINVSAIQFRQAHFEHMLYDAIESHHIDPSRVEIEITESVLIGNQNYAIELIERIRQKGIRVSLDDFGTGYSSFQYLKNFNVDTLKIDKSFVDSIGKEKKSDIIIFSMVEMVRNLGMEIIAEGVETRDQFEILKRLKCDNIQGYLLGRPMSASLVDELFRKQL